MKTYLPGWILLLLATPCHADIYAYVDSNGVRHISNVPNNDRYKMVMQTPTYKKPEAKKEPAPTPSPQSVPAEKNTSTETVALTNSSGWKLITPRGTSYIRWGQGGGKFRGNGKPFAINEANRKRFNSHINAIARQHQLEPALLHAVISAESAYNPQAISHAGAMGLMQLMPATAERFGVFNAYDPVANMQGGARYLRWLLNQFRSVNLALAAYNAGEGAVKRYGNKIPPYEETRTYVSRVLQFYNHYRRTN